MALKNGVSKTAPEASFFATSRLEGVDSVPHTPVLLLRREGQRWPQEHSLVERIYHVDTTVAKAGKVYQHHGPKRISNHSISCVWATVKKRLKNFFDMPGLLLLM